MSIVFDTEALLAFYLNEPGAGRVREMLESVERGETSGYLNIVNLVEFSYILQRRDTGLAEEKERNLRAYGVEIVPIFDDGLWRIAAKIKADHGLSLADSFAAATTKLKKGRLLTGRDAEFGSIGILITRLTG